MVFQSRDSQGETAMETSARVGNSELYLVLRELETPGI